MHRFLPILLMAAALSACDNHSHPDSEKPEALTETPCDSFEMEFFDDNGNPYLMKVPCDTALKK